VLKRRSSTVVFRVVIVEEKSPPFDKLRADFLAKAARSGAPAVRISGSEGRF
jgi:hypothetical protein